MYQREVDVDMMNAVQHIHINLTLIHSALYRYAD